MLASHISEHRSNKKGASMAPLFYPYVPRYVILAYPLPEWPVSVAPLGAVIDSFPPNIAIPEKV